MDEVKDLVKNMGNTIDHTAEYDPADVAANSGISILSYLSWLLLIPFIMRPNSPFVKFHLNQGLVLAILGTVVSLVSGALSNLPLIGFLFGIVGGLAGLGVFGMAVYGIVLAANGKAKELPFIGGIKLLK